MVLITGCTACCDAGLAQIYDPFTNSFRPTGGPNPGCGENGICWFVDTSTATLLPNGTVLIVGSDEYDWPADVEAYDPSTGMFTSLGYTAAPHEFATATLLPDGTVLICRLVPFQFSGSLTAALCPGNPADRDQSASSALMPTRVREDLHRYHSSFGQLAVQQLRDSLLQPFPAAQNPHSSTGFRFRARTLSPTRDSRPSHTGDLECLITTRHR